MKHFIVLILSVFSLGGLLAGEAAWSEPVDGIRARLSIERDSASPFFKVFIEFENTSKVVRTRKLRFNPKSLEAQVTDTSGVELPKSSVPAYSALTPDWDKEFMLLPFESSIRFRISFPGMGVPPLSSQTILDLEADQCWILSDDKQHFLSGTLTGFHAAKDKSPLDWAGVLKLPKATIPLKRVNLMSSPTVRDGKGNEFRVIEKPAQ